MPADDATLYPTLETAGVPAGWTPTETIHGDHVVSERGEVIEDVRIVGTLRVLAEDVVVRRVEVVGGPILNAQGSTCWNGLQLEQVTVRRGSAPTSGHEPAIAHGGYTARSVAIVGLPEGFRVGGADVGCGPVVIEDSVAVAVAPDVCDDWHGDALQGYLGAELVVRNTVLELVERDDCGGTSAFFYPGGQGNTSVDIERLVVAGGGYPFRIGTPGRVEELNFVDESWRFGPYTADCAQLDSWSAAIVELDELGQPVAARPLECSDD